jgi:hypothetical protein
MVAYEAAGEAAPIEVARRRVDVLEAAGVFEREGGSGGVGVASRRRARAERELDVLLTCGIVHQDDRVVAAVRLRNDRTCERGEGGKGQRRKRRFEGGSAIREWVGDDDG